MASEIASAAAGVAKFPVDSDPVLVSVHGHAVDQNVFGTDSDTKQKTSPHSAFDASISTATNGGSRLQWPYLSPSWQPLSVDKSSSLGLLHEARGRIFLSLKAEHFIDSLARSATRPSKTEDDYDYPEDLPQIKINRIRSFRAREAAELLGVSGEDLMQSSMFYQMWKELRAQTPEQQRIQYTHPMDDGQARAFKIRFDGEGVDDYGGPYREIFQQVYDELQAADPSAARTRLEKQKNLQRASGAIAAASSTSATTAQRPTSWGSVLARAHAGETDAADNKPAAAPTESDGARSASFSDPCFLPLLMPTPNWTADECTERYCYMFNPASSSSLRMDLYKFMGQMAGIAVRSHLAVDLTLPSLIWKTIVREKLTEADLASVDVHAADFVTHLSLIQKRIEAAREGGSEGSLANALEEAFCLVQDLTWTATRSDGVVIELVPQGASRIVEVGEIPQYLTAYLHARLTECSAATEAFREGLLTVVPETCFALMTGAELASTVSGADTIDINRLRENTEYDEDVSPSEEYIRNFWEVLKECTEEEKAAFLRFVWARSSLPPRGTPFAQKFKIQGAVGDDASGSPDGYLPRAHTCFFSLNLPKYSSKTVMAEKLRYAIFNCTEMDADFRLTDTDVEGWGAALPTAGQSASASQYMGNE